MIILAGMIGVGKTTYTSRLAEALGTEAFFEPVEENPILNKYYEDPERYGFVLQIYFLNKRFQSIKKAYLAENNVLDRSIYEDALFTYINMLQGSISREEYDIYLELLDNMMEEIDALPKKAPDLLIYLDASFETILDNIKKRGRSYEQVDDNPELLAYYQLLHRHYSQWFDDYHYGPKLKISTDGVDISQTDDWEKVYALIEQELQNLGLIEES